MKNIKLLLVTAFLAVLAFSTMQMATAWVPPPPGGGGSDLIGNHNFVLAAQIKEGSNVRIQFVFYFGIRVYETRGGGLALNLEYSSWEYTADSGYGVVGYAEGVGYAAGSTSGWPASTAYISLNVDLTGPDGRFADNYEVSASVDSHCNMYLTAENIHSFYGWYDYSVHLDGDMVWEIDEGEYYTIVEP